MRMFHCPVSFQGGNVSWRFIPKKERHAINNSHIQRSELSQHNDNNNDNSNNNMNSNSKQPKPTEEQEENEQQPLHQHPPTSNKQPLLQKKAVWNILLNWRFVLIIRPLTQRFSFMCATWTTYRKKTRIPWGKNCWGILRLWPSPRSVGFSATQDTSRLVSESDPTWEPRKSRRGLSVPCQ